MTLITDESVKRMGLTDTKTNAGSIKGVTTVDTLLQPTAKVKPLTGSPYEGWGHCKCCENLLHIDDAENGLCGSCRAHHAELLAFVRMVRDTSSTLLKEGPVNYDLLYFIQQADHLLGGAGGEEDGEDA